MPLDRGFNPLQPAPAMTEELPKVIVRFLNGRTDTGEWTVNRLMTLIGSSPECKIYLSADDVSGFHGYFLLTPTGLWVVDLLTPGGILVNGSPVRFARIGSADTLRIGRFEFGFHYPDGESAPHPAQRHIPAPKSPEPAAVSPRVETEPGTAIIRGQVADHFRQSILEMLESLDEMPREIVSQVHDCLAQVDRLSREVHDLETRTDPLLSINGIGLATRQLAELRTQRKTLWKQIFLLLASTQHEPSED
ncbi:MAG: FHA domain-containing protein [Bacteroidales bacterium]|nr:FHA domain-containing protein [Bacteroidales bacterium]